MLYLNLPVGVAHGWGVCGKNIALQLSHLTQVKLLTPPFTATSVGSALDHHALQQLLPTPEESRRLSASRTLDAPLLQLANKQLQPMTPNLRGSYTLGYCFFEDTDLFPAHLENAKHFDRLSTGSIWCTQILERHGLKNVATVLQGVDPTIFFPTDRPREFFADRFIVFSGGKFEFRKGHDLVLRAFKALQDRHKDVLLLVSWYNPWDFSFRTMSQSPHIKFNPTSNNFIQILTDNGIDPQRVILTSPQPQPVMAHIYRSADVGLFPNRAEGGTNLVLMEFMACGKPVIATNTTGHADIINNTNALVIDSRGEVTSSSDQESTATWPDPDLDQTIAHLEWSYQNRAALAPLAQSAAATLEPLTWRRTAEQFFSLFPQ